jgi:hypothetical protein
MRSACGKRLVLLCALAAAMMVSFAWAQTSSAQSTQPTGQTAPPAPAPKKTPSKPIDPDASAGVRGSGSPLTVRVLMRGKTVENAHVVVKNTNGSIAGSCFTSSTGDCKVEIGPDDYEIAATGNGRSATLKLHVSAETPTVSIKLLKAKPAATAAKP